jgi:hypothetical protein
MERGRLGKSYYSSEREEEEEVKGFNIFQSASHYIADFG